MIFTINDENHDYNEDFLNALAIYKDNRRSFIFTYGMSLINYDMVSLKNIKVKDIPKYKNLLDNDLTVYDIVVMGLKNVGWSKTKNGDKIQFEINFSVNRYGINAKLYEEICRLVDYGVLGISGLRPYPIFTNTFKYVNAHIKDLHLTYIEGGRL